MAHPSKGRCLFPLRRGKTKCFITSSHPPPPPPTSLLHTVNFVLEILLTRPNSYMAYGAAIGAFASSWMWEHRLKPCIIYYFINNKWVSPMWVAFTMPGTRRHSAGVYYDMPNANCSFSTNQMLNSYVLGGFWEPWWETEYFCLSLGPSNSLLTLFTPNDILVIKIHRFMTFW